MPDFKDPDLCIARMIAETKSEEVKSYLLDLARRLYGRPDQAGDAGPNEDLEDTLLSRRIFS
jgi:hypothetical protein